MAEWRIWRAWRRSARMMRRLPSARRLPTDDRRTLEERIFPALYRDRDVRRVLFVGVSEYTSWYPDLFDTHPELVFETVDPDPAAARFGSRRLHHRSRFELLAEDAWAREAYDALVLNGVFGYGTDGSQARQAAVRAAHALLVEDGLLLVGYRAGTHVDVDVAEICAEGFVETPIPGLGVERYRTSHPNGHTYAGFARR